MTSYAFWNNKGGVGKSFLCFVAGCEYAEKHPNDHVYIIDLCPQANVSETLLGGVLAGAKNLTEITSQMPRRTIGGYLEARLSSPFQPLTRYGIQARLSKKNVRETESIVTDLVGSIDKAAVAHLDSVFGITVNW